jgi:hypothetical protein
MAAPDSSMPATTGQPKLSEMERVINTFIAPTKTFEDIKRSALWVTPYILMMVMGLAFVFTAGAKIGWNQIQENNMKMAPAAQQDRINQLPPDQKAQAMQRSLVVTKAISFMFPTLFLLIMAAVIALIDWGTFAFGLGAEINFGRSMAIIMYSFLPGMIKSLLGIITIMAGPDPDSFLMQNAVATNIGHFMNPLESNRALYSLASALDIFTIWMLVLASIGFSVVTGKSRGTSYAVIFGWWAIVTLAGAGLAAAFS